MAWHSWSGWDTAGLIADAAVGPGLEGTGQYFQNLANALRDFARQRTTSSNYYRAIADNLNSIATTQLNSLHAIDRTKFDVKLLTSWNQAVKDLQIAQSALQDANALGRLAKNADVFGKSLGSLVAAGELLCELKSRMLLSTP